MEKKNNTGLIVLVIILIVMVLGLGGYIAYDKILSDKTNIKEEDNAYNTKKEKEEDSLYNEDDTNYETYKSTDNYDILVTTLDLTSTEEQKGKIIDKLDKGVEYYFDYYYTDSFLYIENLYDKNKNIIYSDEKHNKAADLSNLSLFEKDNKLILYFDDFENYESKYYLYENYKLSYTSKGYGSIDKVFDKSGLIAVFDNSVKLIDLNEKVLLNTNIDRMSTGGYEEILGEDNEPVIVIYEYSSNVLVDDIDSNEIEKIKNKYNLNEENLKDSVGYKYTYSVNSKKTDKIPTIVPPIAE